MKNTFLLLSVAWTSLVFAQNMYKPSEAEIATLPIWAQLMYGENPNVYEVDRAYRLQTSKTIKRGLLVVRN